jgi:phage/plasmid-like protein (TIGR03299 family)
MLYNAEGGTPWHHIGDAFKTAPTLVQAATHPTLAWDVEQQPLFTTRGQKSDMVANVRETDGALLGTVGPKTPVYQNSSAFDWFAPFIDDGTATIECVGSLRGGKRVFILAKLAPNSADTEYVTADDKVGRYILLTNAHDGTASIQAGLTLIRVVCSNTLAAALKAGAAEIVSVRHSAQMIARLETVRDAIESARQSSDAVMERYRAMRDIKVTKRSQVDAYLAQVFGAEERKRQEKAAKSNKRSKLANTIEQLMCEGVGTDLPGVKGTAWGLYNALTEYTTHIVGRGGSDRVKAERRAEANMGLRAPLLSKAISDDALAALAAHSASQRPALTMEASGFDADGRFVG